MTRDATDANGLPLMPLFQGHYDLYTGMQILRATPPRPTPPQHVQLRTKGIFARFVDRYTRRDEEVHLDVWLDGKGRGFWIVIDGVDVSGPVEGPAALDFIRGACAAIAARGRRLPKDEQVRGWK